MKSLKQSTEEHKTVHIPSGALQSYERFIDRLKTFDLYKWFAKPSGYSPIQCAKYGWFNYSQNTLKCVSCGNLFYVYTPKNQRPSKTIEIDDKSSRFKLVDQHNTNCPWRYLSVSDSVIEVDLFDKSKTVEMFVRYKISYDKCKQLAMIDEDVYKKIPEPFVDNCSRSIYLAAVCGWSYVEQSDVLKCEKCLRTVGLWLFECMTYENDGEAKSEIKCVLEKIIHSIEFSNDYSNEQQSVTRSNKRKLDDEDKLLKRKKLFNPIESHYSWCPWLKLVNTNQIACQLNNQIIYKHLTGKNLIENSVKPNTSITNERIKSVQSLITHCASFCSLNSN